MAKDYEQFIGKETSGLKDSQGLVWLLYDGPSKSHADDQGL